MAKATKKTAKKASPTVTVDRRKPKADRREADQPVAEASERRKVQRRRQIDPTTCERDYSDDEVEFMRAMDEYKRASGRMFPTCSEILEVVAKLGYEKRSTQPAVAASDQPDAEPALGEPTAEVASTPTTVFNTAADEVMMEPHAV